MNALKITEGGLLERVTLIQDADGHYTVGRSLADRRYVADPSFASQLQGWGDMDGEAVGLVDAEYPESGPEFWIKIEGMER